MIRRVVVLLALVALVSTFGTRAFSQTGQAALTGQVADSTGSVIPGASVQAINQGTGAVSPTRTDSVGRYDFPSLLPGEYQVVVDKNGFKKDVRPGVVLHVADHVSINFTLQVGDVTQTVTVTGGAPVVNTTSGELGGLVEGREIANLPLNGRNYIDLTLMLPGVTPDTNVQPNGYRTGTYFSSDGIQERDNNFMLDGAIMQDMYNASTADYAGRTLGVDGIQEFRVLQVGYAAEYPLVAGSQTIMVSKSGTNKVHGTAFEYLRNNAMDAANYFDKPIAANNFARLPPFKRNNFGASIGGPLKKDKLFYFLTYEGVHEGTGETIVDNVPAAGCHGPAGAVITNTACPELGTTASVTISPVTAPLLALYPLPNLPNFQATFPYTQPDSDNFGQARVDQMFSPNDSLFGRYSIFNDVLDSYTNWNQYFTAPKYTRHQYVTISESHVLSSSMLNTSRISYSRNTAYRLSLTPSSLMTPQYQFVANQGFGQLTVGGLTLFGGNPAPSNAAIQDVYTVSDDFSYQRGRQAFKFGALINRYQQYATNPTFATGQLQFGNVATFLAGGPATENVATSTNGFGRTYRFYTTGFYAQDDWQIRPNLTLSAGVRYEPAPDYYNEAHGVQSVLVHPLTDAAPLTGQGFWQHNPTLLDFGPRVGFAWTPFGNDKTAVRGSGSMLYNVADLGGIIIGDVKSEPPFSSSRSRANAPASSIVLPLDLTGAAASTTFYTSQYLGFKTPRFYTWNLTVEQQFLRSASISVSYIGTRGTHLVSDIEANPDLSATCPTGVVCNGGWYGPTPQVRGNTNWGTIIELASTKDSYYHGLQIAATKSMTKGLQFRSYYTWARSIDNAAASQSDCIFSSGASSNPFNSRFDRGPSCFQASQIWVTNFVYTFPSPHMHERILGAVAGGWGMMGIYTARSGFPFHVWDQLDRARVGIFGGSSNPPLDRPSWNPAFTGKVIQGGPIQYYNPNAFILQPVGTLGNVGRDSLYGPGFENADFAVQKDNRVRFLGEAGNIEFRAEFFNIFNRPNFGPPNSAVFAGTLTDVTETPLTTAGQILQTAGKSRQVELALRVKW